MTRQKARELRNHPTDAERFLRSHLRLRQLGGHKFRRQQRLGPYIVDFVYLEKRLIVEVDGGQHVEQIDYDSKRDNWLRGEAFTVLRFWDHDVLMHVEDLKQVIWEALSAPSSILPRNGGEED